jgi:galactose mutarotase-like enzyme
VLSDAPWVVVLTARPEGVCVEPQTGPPNGLNNGSYTLVEPGAPLVTTMTLAWAAAAGRP